MSEILWEPSAERIRATLLDAFRRSAPGAPATYDELWRWSIHDLDGFWSKVWQDCEVLAHREPDEILANPAMPGAEWFPGARLNFAENLLGGPADELALVGCAEGRPDEAVTRRELRRRVACVQAGLEQLGVEPGDRVAAVLPNGVEAVVLALASIAAGAVWSSCSPDFGPMGLADRFAQIDPKILCAVDGYRYGGKTFELRDTVDRLLGDLPSVEHVVTVDFVGGPPPLTPRSIVPYERLLEGTATEPQYVALPFDQPIYVLYSSGTTGPPKSIVHGAGGTLLKHLSEHQLQSDVHPRDVLCYFTTTGWMMWNWLVGALASGATVVCYDGSPTHPTPDALWDVAQRWEVTHLGVSPRLLAAHEAAGTRPRETADLGSLRALLSTGAPLGPAQFDWAYREVKSDMQLASISGGTDLLGCFVGGVPTLPVRRGEIQGRVLGMAVEAWDERGQPVTDEPGELVCTRPFPSMPLGFWGDDGTRYREAYFSEHPGVWTHGDFVEIRTHGGVVVHGRSDTTLNPGGVRIGTAEIYRAVEPLPEVRDAIAVGYDAGAGEAVALFVQLAEHAHLDDALAERIRQAIREATTPRHVPSRVVQVSAVPYTRSGKKVEKAVRRVLAGRPVDNRDALADPAVLDEYAQSSVARDPGEAL